MFCDAPCSNTVHINVVASLARPCHLDSIRYGYTPPGYLQLDFVSLTMTPELQKEPEVTLYGKDQGQVHLVWQVKSHHLGPPWLCVVLEPWSGPSVAVWVSRVALIRPLRDCGGRQQMLVGVTHSAVNVPHVWNTMTTQARHNTHT